MTFVTEQENFWAEDFGSAYIERNKDDAILSGNLSLFSKIFSTIPDKISSVLEFGANIGLNLQAIKTLLPAAELSAIEINENAVAELNKQKISRVYHQSILDFKPDYQRDLVLSKVVLIHINEQYLPIVYDALYQSAKKYILLVEYYNPTPVQVPYRGFSDRLFKRDFAGDMLDKYATLSLVDYGFLYRRDKTFACDDATWFLLKKN